MRFLTDWLFGKEEEEVMGRHAMRRSPGGWQTLRFKTTLLVILTLTSAVLGVLVGALSAQWLSPTWTIWGLGISMVGLLAATWWVWRGDLGRLRKRYSMIDLEKGIEAERRTGEVIEFALAYPNCAEATRRAVRVFALVSTSSRFQNSRQRIDHRDPDPATPKHRRHRGGGSGAQRT